METMDAGLCFFCRMVNMAASAGLIGGSRTADYYPLISHFQFADDTLIFCEANKEQQVKNVKAILICFEALSGLKVNFFKSELIGVTMGDANIKKLADLFGCKAGQFLYHI